MGTLRFRSTVPSTRFSNSLSVVGCFKPPATAFARVPPCGNGYAPCSPISTSPIGRRCGRCWRPAIAHRIWLRTLLDHVKPRASAVSYFVPLRPRARVPGSSIQTLQISWPMPAEGCLWSCKRRCWRSPNTGLLSA